MKNKGIPFIEQHIEKFVLGATGVVFFSVVAWQVLGSHNDVTLDGREVRPSEIDDALARRTETLRQRLDAPAPSLSEKLEGRLAPQSSSYAAKLGTDIGPAGTLPAIEPRLAAALQSDGAMSGKPFHVPQFAGLAMRPALQLSDTLDETAVEKNEELKSLLSSGSGSNDVTWVVPSAVLDVAQVRQELASGKSGAVIPPFWYQNSVFVIDIEFERERRLSDGGWGEREIVMPLPGQFSFRPEIAKGADAGLRDSAFNYLSDMASQRAILQPEFFPTKGSKFNAGLVLEDRDEGEARSEDPEQARLQDEIRRLRKDVTRFTVDVTRLKEDLDAIGGPLEDTTKEDKEREERRRRDEERNRGGNSGGGGLGKPGGGLGGAAGGMGEGRRRPGDEANKERRIKLTKTLKEKERRLTAAQDALAKKQEEAGVAATQASEPADAGTTNLDKAESIIVWAHDLGVAPGEQYRYRAVAKVYNPFFTYGSLLVSDQKKLAEDFTIATPVSDWSDPYRVTPPVEFFVVDAQAGEGRLGTGQATVEVYRYVDGQRRVERFVVQPGDLIRGRADRSGADFGTGFYLVDVFADPSIERGANERRAVSVAVVQNASGDRYEIRVPRSDAADGRRRDLIDEIELAKDAGDSEDPTEAPKGGSGLGGAGGVGNPDSPYGPGGRG
ncbi:MAG: hypothetical protein RLZZ238_1204 [Planctomycetota bacterium]